MSDAEMVAVARVWVEQRIAQYRDERESIHTWGWRMYRDLCDVVQFDPLDNGHAIAPPEAPENGSTGAAS